MLRDLFSYQHLSGAQLPREFTTVTAQVDITAGNGRDDGAALQVQGSDTSGAGNYVEKLYDAQPTWYWGHRLKLTALPTSTGWTFLHFCDGATVQAAIGVGTDGKVVAYRGTSTVVGSSTAALTAGVSCYLEVSLTIHPSAGEITVVVDGDVWLNLTAQNTRATSTSSADTIRWGNATNYNAGSDYTYYCDGYLADDQAGETRELLGPRVCNAYVLAVDGTYTNGVPSTGDTRAAVVDERPANDDVDYVTLKLGDKLTVKTLSLGLVPSQIDGMKLTGVMKKTSSLDIVVARLMRSGATDYKAEIGTPGSSYSHLSEVFEHNPATSAYFTQANLESGLEFGFELAAPRVFLNPADCGIHLLFSDDQLTLTTTQNFWSTARANRSVSSGKWYFECQMYFRNEGYLPGEKVVCGLCRDDTNLNTYLGNFSYQWGFMLEGRCVTNSNFTRLIVAQEPGAVVMVAFDLDNGYLWFGVDGAWLGDPNGAFVTGTTPAFAASFGTVAPAVCISDTDSSAIARFKASSFDYSPPTGFSPLDLNL